MAQRSPSAARGAAARPPFVDHCLELLAPLGTVRTRRMFGGWGLYVDELFLALIAGERLYLKADAESRNAFEAAACEPFVYRSDGKSVSLGYWTAPAEALDSPALMTPWARLALQAALRARTARLKPSRADAGPAKPAAPRARTTKTATRRAAPGPAQPVPRKPKPA